MTNRTDDLMSEPGFRFQPRQRRSEETIDVLLEAAAQVLDQPKQPAFTTNHIAHRAGVSIGTLYRYFPNKGRIQEILILREIERRENKITKLLSDKKHASGSEALDMVIETTLGAFEGRSRVRLKLAEQLQENVHLRVRLNEMRRRVLQLLEDHLVRVEPQRYQRLNEIQQKAVLGSWLGCVNALLGFSARNTSFEDVKLELKMLLEHHFRLRHIGKPSPLM